MSNNFDGDIMIFLTYEGADIYESSGNIHTDSAILNMITTLLFLGNKNIHYTLLFQEQNYSYESKTPEILKKPITVSMMRDLDSAIRSDLSYLVDNDLIILEDISIKNSGPKVIEISLLVFIVNSNERVRRLFRYSDGNIESIMV